MPQKTKKPVKTEKKEALDIIWDRIAAKIEKLGLSFLLEERS